MSLSSSETSPLRTPHAVPEPKSIAVSSAARAKFTSPFAALQLRDNEVEALEELSRLILHNYIDQYEELERARVHAATGNLSSTNATSDGVDERAWKLLKQGDDFAIFKQRKPQRDSSLCRTVAKFSASGAVAPSDLPVILALGHSVGSLDDIMYGIVSPTVEAMRVKSAYIDDHFTGAAVLQTIVAPSHAKPFQSLVIKWAHIEQSLVLRPAVNNRDFVFMERTGVTRTSAGERLGFHLIHSVHFPQTHELSGLVRGNLSICGLFRDNPGLNRVEGYARSIIDPCGSAIHSLVALAAADTLTAGGRYVECAQRKKLLWRLRQQRMAQHSGKQQPTIACVDKLGPCTSCRRTPNKIGGVLRDPRKRRCALCTQYVCSACRVKRTLSQVAAPTAKLQQREFAFCNVCFEGISRSDAVVIAQQELAEATTMVVEKEPLEALSASGSDS